MPRSNNASRIKEMPGSLGERLGSLFRRYFPGRSKASDASDVESPPPQLSEHDLQWIRLSYLRRLQERYRTIVIYGLDEKRHALQEHGHMLDRLALYVPLNTTATVPIDADASQGGSQKKTRQLTLLEAIDRERHTIIRGTLGTARTTFVAFFALALSEHWVPSVPAAADARQGLARLEPEWTHGPRFPLLVGLGDFAVSEYNDHETGGLLAFIAAELGISADQLQRQFIEPGGIVFMLDGLEYAPAAVQAFYRRFAGTANRWVIVAQEHARVHDADTRDAGTGQTTTNALDGFAEVSIADLTAEQIDRFVRHWYAELQRKGWIDQESARDLPGQLCALLRRSDVFELARRRSLLMLITVLYTISGQIGKNRTLFYHRLIDLAIAHWSESKGQDEQDLRQIFDAEQLREAVAQVTYQAYARLDKPGDLIELPEADLRAVLASVCHEGQWQAVSELVHRIAARPGLLELRRPSVYAFPFPSLQAYVAARFLAAQPELPRLVLRLVHENFYHWRQVISFAIERLVLLDANLGKALDVLDALCLRPSALDEINAGEIPEDRWRQVWLVGECLAEIDSALRNLNRTFPKDALPVLGCVKRWLATVLDRGILFPVERAKVGSTLVRLPGDDPRPGVCQPEPVWCQVPGAAFWQGEGSGARLVELRSFWIARHPVTNAQYAAFVEQTGSTPPKHWNGSRPPREIRNHPVVQVTWKEANAYCQWLSQRLPVARPQIWRADRIEPAAQIPDHFVVRLPTSAEWEMAARGGLSIPAPGTGGLTDNPAPRRAYPWGDSWQLSTMDAPGDEMRCNISESNIGTTTPVGMYPDGASPYGVLDMAGNVWEWCHDWIDDRHQYKIRRGGAFRYSHDQARCSSFDKAHPGLGWPYLGFRVVFGPPQPQ